jgi:hypothetical protein
MLTFLETTSSYWYPAILKLYTNAAGQINEGYDYSLTALDLAVKLGISISDNAAGREKLHRLQTILNSFATWCELSGKVFGSMKKEKTSLVRYFFAKTIDETVHILTKYRRRKEAGIAKHHKKQLVVAAQLAEIKDLQQRRLLLQVLKG